MAILSKIEMDALEAQKMASTQQIRNTLTKREQIAALAMQSIITEIGSNSADEVVKRSYMLADLMLDASKAKK